MSDIIFWGSITLFVFIGGIALVIFSAVRKKLLLLAGGIVLFLISIGSGLYFGYLVLSKSQRKLSAFFSFKPRSGIEIYRALFGNPVVDCVEVSNSMDQIVPKLDCCIWLEFHTCTAELKRILEQEQDFETYYYTKKDTGDLGPSYGPRPDFWNPKVGEDTLIQKIFTETNRQKIFFFSRDSSHVFYCDMLD